MGPTEGSAEGRIPTESGQNPLRLFFGYDWLDKPAKIPTFERNDASIPAGMVQDFTHGALGEQSSQFGDKASTFQLEHYRRLRIALKILAQHEFNGRADGVLNEAAILPIVARQAFWSPTGGNMPGFHCLRPATTGVGFKDLDIGPGVPDMLKVSIKGFRITLA